MDELVKKRSEKMAGRVENVIFYEWKSDKKEIKDKKSTVI